MSREIFATKNRPLATLAALLCALAVAFLLAACSKSVPKLPPLTSKATVLAFGDSLTFGTGAGSSKSYPAQLAALIGREVVNRGVPGEISSDGLARLPAVLDEVQPALLILCHGGNDFLRKLGDAGAERNVEAMIRLAQERGIAVVLMATPKPGLSPSAAEFYRAIAERRNVPLENEILADVLGSRSLKSDLVHPNAEGYSRIAAAMAKLLKRAGAIS